MPTSAGAPLVIIQGGDEKAKGEVQIKDLRLGTELAANIVSREEYASQRLAQVIGARKRTRRASEEDARMSLQPLTSSSPYYGGGVTRSVTEGVWITTPTRRARSAPPSPRKRGRDGVR